jgi:hypothetical protein
VFFLLHDHCMHPSALQELNEICQCYVFVTLYVYFEKFFTKWVDFARKGLSAICRSYNKFHL